MADDEQLEEEREFSRKNRDKFAAYGGTGTMATNTGGMGGGNSKYTGFGSQDLNKYNGGYDVQGKDTNAYDPFKRKGGSVFDAKPKGEKKWKKKETKKEKEKAKKKAKKSKKHK